MSKNNMLLGFARGKVGDLVFSRRLGQQITRAYNPNPANPQSSDQMAQRTKLSGLVNVYRCLRVILDHSFTDRKNGQTSYNAFVSANMPIAPRLTADQAKNGVVVVLPYLVSRGTLPKVYVSGAGDNAFTNINIGELEITDDTTIAEFSQAVINNNASWMEGDQLSYISVIQTVTGGSLMYYHGIAQEFKITLDTKNTETLRAYMPDYATAVVNGFLGHGEHFASGGFCWIHSRKDTSGALLVSTQELICNIDNSVFQGADQEEAAKRSYGYTQEKYLVPGIDAQSPANIALGIDYGVLTPGNGSDEGMSLVQGLFVSWRPAGVTSGEPFAFQIAVNGSYLSLLEAANLQVQFDGGTNPTPGANPVYPVNATDVTFAATDDAHGVIGGKVVFEDAGTSYSAIRIRYNGEVLFEWRGNNWYQS